MTRKLIFKIRGRGKPMLDLTLGAGLVFAVCGFVLAPIASAQVAIDEEFAHEPTWKSPTAAEVRGQVMTWLKDAKLDDAIRQQATALWPEKTADEASKADATKLEAAKAGIAAPVLERVVKTFALVDPSAAQLAELCSHPHSASKTPEFAWLTDEKTSTFLRNNSRLWLGQWLAQERFYDEALEQLKGLQPADVVDPAALLFYQSVCYHWMLHKDDGLKSISQLLEQRKNIPRRYAELADLMQADLSGLQDESLDHISRRMNDVTRRLDFGHAGKTVRGEEDGIITSLDKLIKEQEDMANSMSSGGGEGQGREQEQPGGDPNGPQGNPQGTRSRSPAAESRLARGQGAGEVKNKNIGNHSGWGDLPPKDREAAMQQISKDFPSHYRDVIEQYFRKLASEDEDQNQK